MSLPLADPEAGAASELPVVLVKLGGSLITDKEGREEARPEVMARLAAELAVGIPAARERGRRVILGHGSGSFGHVAAAEHGVADGFEGLDEAARGRRRSGASWTQGRAAALHHQLLAELRAEDLAPFSIPPSATLVASRGQAAAMAVEPLCRALLNGFLPVVYGDVVMDRERGVTIASTEAVFRALADALPTAGHPVVEILWLGETAGVYDEAGATIPEISAAPSSAPLGAASPSTSTALPPSASPASAGRARGTDVTGGMAHRVESALALATAGIPSCIADGTVPGLLARALSGEETPGTWVTPAP